MIDRDCSTCKYLELESFEGVCNKHHVVLEDTVACSDYEETEDCTIVDDVDVSDCEFFNAKYEGCHCFNTKEAVYAIDPNDQNRCKGTNCYYKKLKRILSKGSLDNE